MNEQPIKVLLVEDNPGDVYIIKEALKFATTNFTVLPSPDLGDAIKVSHEQDFDVILLDLGLPDSIGIETLKKMLASDVTAPVVVMTGLNDEEAALEAMKEGAQDYLVKNNLTAENIVRSIRYGIERKKIQKFQEKNARQFSILSSATMGINECEDVTSIYRIICEKVNQLLHHASVFPINFSDPTSIIYDPCKDATGPFFNWIQNVHQLTQDQSIGVSDYLKSQFQLKYNGKLEDVGDSFRKLVPQGIGLSAALETIQGYTKTYFIDFSRDDKLYGGLFIFMKQPVDKNDADIIEAISSQASLNIHRRKVENDLKLSENSYKLLYNEVTIAKEELQKLNAELDLRIQMRTQELAEINTLLHLELDEHVQTSKKLRDSEEKYRLLFTRMIDGFALHEIMLDSDGKPYDYKYVSVNPAFEQLTGLQSRRIIGRTGRALLPESFNNWIGLFGEVALTGKNVEFESYNAEINKHVKVNAFCPKKGFFALILEDITTRVMVENEKKKAEEQLKKHALDLKNLNATKDKFFGIIAHDLKNPFSGILGASELLTDYVDQFDIKNIKVISELLHDSAKRGFALLENLLEWSRSQTGNIRFSPQKINVKDLITENLANLQHIKLNKNIEIHSFVTGDLEIYGDINMLNTVIRNLLNNAVKFTHRNGQVSVSAEGSDKQVTIAVKDTGIGIAKKDIGRLFRIDVQFTNFGTDQEKGTGLGLLLCKEFVEQHGGKIWVESIVGRGSEFKFTVPVREEYVEKLDKRYGVEVR